MGDPDFWINGLIAVLVVCLVVLVGVGVFAFIQAVT